MATGGSVAIQGCAIRASRLSADGSVVVGATDMFVDDKPFVKFTAKPVMEAGVEITPKSACGAPLVSYKDYDRVKRWDVTLDLGDFDPEKQELLQGGSLLTAVASTGRTFADGITTLNSTTLGSAALANFTTGDVGRGVTGAGIPANTIITDFIDATHVVMSKAATASATGISVTLATLALRTIGYQAAALLSVPSPNGVSIEIWQKLMVRSTGYQGTRPYPSMGDLALPSSAWLRWGWFRCYLFPGDVGIEDKESADMYVGWAIENPNFGTGPKQDWTETGAAGGPPVDTTKVYNAMADIALPTPLQPGYQTTTAP